MSTEAQDIREMKRLLMYANYQKVGDAVGVSRATVSEWSRGIDVSPARVTQVREVMLRSVGRRKRSAAPDVPERLDEILIYLQAIAGGVPISPEDRAAIEALHRGALATRRNGPPPGAQRPKAKRRPPGT